MAVIIAASAPFPDRCGMRFAVRWLSPHPVAIETENFMSLTRNISSIFHRSHLNTRFTAVDTVVHEPEESLVGDERCGQRPAQMVEGKLVRMLKESFALVSQLRIKGMVRHRGL